MSAVDPLPVTAVVPAYRRPDLVREAVLSARAQQPPPAEVLVVDDASGDGTADAAEQAGARVVRLESNLGEGGARTTGVREARTPWVALLDSDDAWLPGHLQRVWAARGDHVLVCERGVGSASGRLSGNVGGRARALRSPADLFWPDNPVVVSSVLARRDALLEARGFDARPLAADLAAWVRLLRLGTGLALTSTGSVYGEHDGQVSLDRTGMYAAVQALLDEHDRQPWVTPGLRRRVSAQQAWDRWRADPQDRGSLAALLGRPRSATALPSLWAWRLRQRSG